jgi:hypothetical protein
MNMARLKIKVINGDHYESTKSLLSIILKLLLR